MHVRIGMRGITLAGVAALAIATAGCAKLKARDHLNQGVNAFRTGNYSAAADEFNQAIEADPTFGTAKLYLANAYMLQYVPGNDSADNNKYWKAAMDEFNQVLDSNPIPSDKKLATQSIANLYYQIKDIPNAVVWNKKVIELDPSNKEAYYTLGVLAWQDFLSADREARLADGMKVDEQAPLKPDPKGKTTKADLKAKYWQSLTDGLEYEKKALAIDPQYDSAMAYMNLLTRYRADLDDTKAQYDADAKEADEWLQKTLDTQKAKAAKKDAAEAAGATAPAQ